MTDRMAGTAAVLDEMVAGIMGQKAEKGTKLTPVGMEGVPFVSKSQQFSPLESPYTGLLDACRRIREGMAMLDKYVSAIERDAKSINDNRGPTTRMADALGEDWDKPSALSKPAEDMTARIKRLEAEAQASAFAEKQFQSSEHGDGSHVTPPWTCSLHGDLNISKHTSPRGREYMACDVSGCKEFQR